MLKASKKQSKRLKKLQKPILLLSVGFLLFFSGLYHYLSIRRLSFSEVPQTNVSERGSSPINISIPSIEVNVQVENGAIKNGVWDISYDKATYLVSSQKPGIPGNTVIYAHNKKALFGSLPYLSIGQKIYVKTQDGVEHVYEVYRKDFVKPDRVDLVSPTDNEELTLFTCWGLFDSDRVVVKAKPI